MDYNALSLIPPLLAIFLAILTKDVVISLVTGIFAGQLILHNFNPASAFIHFFDDIISLFSESWITKTLLFALMVGAIIQLIIDSGGVNGFVHYLSKKKDKVNSKQSALFLAFIIGLVVFIESSLTSLIAGTVARPLTDKYGVSRQKLAYVCDATAAPVCSLIALNAWGALLIGLITAQINAGIITGNATTLFISSIPFNFYALISVALVFFTIRYDWNIGSMKTFEANAQPLLNVGNETEKGNPLHMLLPLAVLIGTMPIALYLTGDGNLFNGSGSTSVFYAVVNSLLFTFVYYLFNKVMTKKAFYKSFYKGLATMLPITLVLILAFAIGNMSNELGTGKFLATLAQDTVSPALIPVIVFFLAALIAFSTGTSWGTFSIMMPIAISLAVSTEAALALTIGAVVSGGIFGDHASPISDTTIISSMAAGCDHMEHVNSQLPYALVGGGLSVVLFIVFGYIL
jgi:Na+/H+ antiporter NhaC